MRLFVREHPDHLSRGRQHQYKPNGPVETNYYMIWFPARKHAVFLISGRVLTDRKVTELSAFGPARKIQHRNQNESTATHPFLPSRQQAFWDRKTHSSMYGCLSAIGKQVASTTTAAPGVCTLRRMCQHQQLHRSSLYSDHGKV